MENEQLQKNELSCGSEKIEQKNPSSIKIEDLSIKKICKGKCSICASPHILEIQELRKSGIQLIPISDAILNKHGLRYSMSALSRHFTNYFERQMEVSSKIINNDLISEATAKSVHTQNTIRLIDLAFDKITAMAQSGNYKFDINDLEKLINLRYKTLVGNENLDKDIVAIFQKATDKYGLSMQQGVLFNH